jgi:hypothetical protein
MPLPGVDERGAAVWSHVPAGDPHRAATLAESDHPDGPSAHRFTGLGRHRPPATSR